MEITASNRWQLSVKSVPQIRRVPEIEASRHWVCRRRVQPIADVNKSHKKNVPFARGPARQAGTEAVSATCKITAVFATGTTCTCARVGETGAGEMNWNQLLRHVTSPSPAGLLLVLPEAGTLPHFSAARGSVLC